MTYSAKCTGCGRCVGSCPVSAINVASVDGKYIAVTDRDLCKDCGQCTAICPSEAREIAGKPMTVSEVLNKVLKDKLFIDASGGGMTISGGECLAHPAFSSALLRAAKEAGLHTAVESCCYASRDIVERVFRDVDFAMLDIKQMDPVKHLAYTGVSNELILENIKFIHNELGIETMISLPTIPGYNDDRENISATAEFVAKELGNDVKIRLLPYHRLGESKNESLGKQMDFSIEIPEDSHMEELKALVESFGVQAQIGG